jgi:hypothetical protein
MEKKHPGSATVPPNPYNTPNVTSARMAVTPLENREFQKINLRMNGGLLEILLLEEVPVAVLHVVPVLVHRAVLLPRMGRLRSKMCQISLFLFINPEHGRKESMEK